jgi:D-amino-acid dehydrogenase
MSKNVVVVGGGIIGLCCAYYLMRGGHRVTVVDRGEAATENCSYGNAGLVVPSHIVPMAAPGVMMAGIKWMRDPESPFFVKPRLSPGLAMWGWQFFRAGTKAHVERSAPLLRDLNMASRAAYDELNEELSGFDFEKRGLMMLFKTAAAIEEESHVVAQANKLGMPAEILDAKGAKERDPAIRMDIEGAAYYPNDCHLSPSKFMITLQRELEKGGATLRWETEICDWKSEGGQVRSAILATKKGEREELEAEEWVICGGSWSPEMAKKLRLSLPMQAGKGYSITLPQPKHQPSVPSILGEARVAVTPMGQTLRFAGTMEIDGMSTTVNPRRVNGILKAIPRYFPDFTPNDFEGLKAWAGLRPCSPDGLPFVGRTGRYKNLSVATGHAMMGLSLGPITGKLISETISGRTSQLSSTLLNPDRYL